LPEVLVIAPDSFMLSKTFFLQDYVDTGGVLAVSAELKVCGQ
jgi:hypothetical protein